MVPRFTLTRSATGMALAVLPLVFGTGCATTGGAYKEKPGYTERGLASWYGPGFHGKQAANGETYDMNQLTAAHRTLPFDTVVQVRNRENGRRVEVRVTDRGPFVRGRIIDLSYEAARQLEMLGPGVVEVEIRVIAGGPMNGRSSDFWVQAGAFRDAEEAEVFYQRLRQKFPEAKLSTDGTWHRVRLGPFDKRKQAERTRRRLGQRGIDAFLTQL